MSKWNIPVYFKQNELFSYVWKPLDINGGLNKVGGAVLGHCPRVWRQLYGRSIGQSES